MGTSGRHLCCAILICLVLLLLSPASVATTPHTELFRSPNGRFELRLLSDFDKGRKETWQLVDTSTGNVLLTMREILSFSIGFLSDDGLYLADLPPTLVDSREVAVRLWRAGQVHSEFTIGDLGLDPQYFNETSVGLVWYLGPCQDCPLPFSFKDNLLVVTTNDWRKPYVRPRSRFVPRIRAGNTNSARRCTGIWVCRSISPRTPRRHLTAVLPNSLVRTHRGSSSAGYCALRNTRFRSTEDRDGQEVARPPSSECARRRAVRDPWRTARWCLGCHFQQMQGHEVGCGAQPNSALQPPGAPGSE